ncbi:MAG TPA: galactose-1-phosphate uridylyltransferase [Cytophagales bacterium]|nr:galactose-1-phosphate uridylyltransferase [Cytophagales bacterium]
MQFDYTEHSHRRLNILTGEWVQVSPHRAKRPWQGQVEVEGEKRMVQYDPTCYLCPGNRRSNGETNEDYALTYSFVNDFSALVDDVPEGKINDSDLLIAQSERGICKVICFSPDHSLTIADMPVESITHVVERWKTEFALLAALPNINYVQVFENKGAMMGCSNPHPHGQIWAQASIPVEPLKKHYQQQAYFKRHHRTILTDYLNRELQLKERIVAENNYFVALVPFWAVWPYETMIIPRRPMQHITELTASETQAFAEMYSVVAKGFDNLFNTSCPYSAGIHQAPCDNEAHPEWHWHMVFLPPLLRSATVKKFMVGYEMLANPQRDISPEQAADKLRHMIY